ncbi:alpha-hydroxy acid oxidase [Thauera aromatica]|uniref:FMN-dependent dehydrogenase n=1 Tax=Thauera aromatica K172 TaxID=44139 RepID=A0A2R4BI98_THAAR|nr:alpha-hydroxy acid oxidase [Thauera aromatica]AVR87040.1 FMN-dependent dehydrogenase [Thauera aromatica K172]
MKLNVEDYRRAARAVLPRFVFDYVDGAAERGDCLQRNRDGLDRLTILPRVLRDTTRLDTRIEVFGETWRRPFAIAPMGFNGLTRPQGDVLLARAAAAAGVPFVLSTASNARIEAVVQPSSALNWFQLYVMRERSIAEQMVRRARRAGYRALVLTVDVPVSGYRERDVRNGFKMPFRPSPATLVNLAMRPRWLLRFIAHGMPSFVNLAEEEGSDTLKLQAALLSREMDRSLSWESVDWLRRLWDGPLLLKGVLHPDDARQARAHGVDGLIVSNHGGRQLDGAIATIGALEAVLDAVEGRLPVFVDSGFRSGLDVAKALALGARGVFLGRPLLYGLAVDGEAGAAAVLELIAGELERTMILAGARHIAELERGLLRAA